MDDCLSECHRTFFPNCYSSCTFCCAILCISTASAVVWCLCLSITFAYSVEMSKHIFKIFGPLGNHTIVVYFIPNVMAILRRGPSLTGASNAGGVGKNCDSRPLSDFGIDDWWSVINSFDHEVKCITADADDDRQASVNLVYDSKGCIVTD